MQKYLVGIGGVVLAGATIALAPLLVEAQVDDRAYIMRAVSAPLDTSAKTSALVTAVQSFWPSVVAADFQELRCWQSLDGESAGEWQCKGRSDVDASTLSDADLWALALEGAIDSGAATVPRQWPVETADASQEAALNDFVAEMSSLGLDDYSEFVCRRGSPHTCHARRYKVASLSTWRADWEAGNVHRVLGTVAE